MNHYFFQNGENRKALRNHTYLFNWKGKTEDILMVFAHTRQQAKWLARDILRNPKFNQKPEKEWVPYVFVGKYVDESIKRGVYPICEKCGGPCKTMPKNIITSPDWPDMGEDQPKIYDSEIVCYTVCSKCYEEITAWKEKHLNPGYESRLVKKWIEQNGERQRN